jgi:ATP-binding cassette subfamily D (ALD) long-chain fatty acid import protein
MAILSKPAREFVQAQRRPLVLAALIVVFLRSRLGSIGKEGLDAVKERVVGKGKGRVGGKMDKEESLKVLQKIYEEDPKDEETKVLLVPYRDRVTKVGPIVSL